MPDHFNTDDAAAKFASELRRAVLGSCILALLHSGERYGFDLVRSLSDDYGLTTAEGTVYPLLSRLQKDGLVSSYWQPSDAGPPRKYYRITSDGRQALAVFSSEWQRFSHLVDQLIDPTDPAPRALRPPIPTTLNGAS